MRFSIITPSYNQLDWLRLCVASVRDQAEEKAEGVNLKAATKNLERRTRHAPSLLAVEHIIQDAGTPGIEDFAREIGAALYREGVLQFAAEASGPRQVSDRDSWVPRSEKGEGASSPTPSYRIVIFCESDNGMYDAINRGLRRATGEYCAYLNCDEQYLPGALTSVASFFSNYPSADVVFADALVVDSDNRFIARRKSLVPQRLHTMVSGNLAILTCATFFRRKLLEEEKFFFPSDYRVAGDAAWILRLLDAAISMKTISCITSAFVDTGDNLALSEQGKIEIQRLRNMAPFILKKFPSIVVWHYRLRKLLAGGYRREPLEYSLYSLADPAARSLYRTDLAGGVWTGRISKPLSA